MKLSLSGRLWETAKGYRIDLPGHIRTAAELGFPGIELRYPLLPKPEDASGILKLLRQQGVTPVLAFCAGIPHDTASRADYERVLAILHALNTPFVRIAVTQPIDIPAIQAAARMAEAFHLQVLIHVHINTACDRVEPALSILKAVDRPNVGLLADPLHLVLAGEPDPVAALNRLAPHLRLVNLQAMRHTRPPEPDGELHMAGAHWTRCLPGESGGIDFAAVLNDLRRLKYDGWLNIMPAVGETEDPVATARAYRTFLAPMLAS